LNSTSAASLVPPSLHPSAQRGLSYSDRRFAETIYRVALADGIMDRVTYQDPPEDAS
jgi:hypothetical protein